MLYNPVIDTTACNTFCFRETLIQDLFIVIYYLKYQGHYFINYLLSSGFSLDSTTVQGNCGFNLHVFDSNYLFVLRLNFVIVFIHGFVKGGRACLTKSVLGEPCQFSSIYSYYFMKHNVISDIDKYF